MRVTRRAAVRAEHLAETGAKYRNLVTSAASVKQ